LGYGKAVSEAALCRTRVLKSSSTADQSKSSHLSRYLQAYLFIGLELVLPNAALAATSVSFEIVHHLRAIGEIRALDEVNHRYCLTLACTSDSSAALMGADSRKQAESWSKKT